MGISIVALIISIYSWYVHIRKTETYFIRIKTLLKGIVRDINSIHFSFNSIHLIPGEQYIESHELSLSERRGILEKKLNLFSDHLVEDLKISNNDKEQIFEYLIEVEDSLFELYHFVVEEKEDLQVSQSFINSMLKSVDKIENIILGSS